MNREHFNLNIHQEEFWNAVSHAIGVILGLVGLGFLLAYRRGQTSYSLMSVLIYGISIIILYTASTIYHFVKHVRWKEILRRVDHISIYFLIAGTYTPVALITLEQGSGWALFWLVWGIAAVGAVLKIFFTGRFEFFSLALYLFMGWLIVFDFNELMAGTTVTGRSLLLLGGALYMLGIVFYVIRKIPYNHLIWHFFVLGGSIAHFLFIFLDVI